MNKQTRRAYRRHFVKVGDAMQPVKDWMRDNESKFRDVKGVPTSYQIGAVLEKEGFVKSESDSMVVYR